MVVKNEKVKNQESTKERIEIERLLGVKHDEVAVIKAKIDELENGYLATHRGVKFPIIISIYFFK